MTRPRILAPSVARDRECPPPLRGHDQRSADASHRLTGVPPAPGGGQSTPPPHPNQHVLGPRKDVPGGCRWYGDQRRSADWHPPRWHPSGNPRVGRSTPLACTAARSRHPRMPRPAPRQQLKLTGGVRGLAAAPRHPATTRPRGRCCRGGVTRRGLASLACAASGQRAPRERDTAEARAAQMVELLPQLRICPQLVRVPPSELWDRTDRVRPVHVRTVRSVQGARHDADEILKAHATTARSRVSGSLDATVRLSTESTASRLPIDRTAWHRDPVAPRTGVQPGLHAGDLQRKHLLCCRDA